ncbi:MAG: ferrous iron transporter B [Deltaproteobacteria bacterium]|nr:ferrous iron transporter B [Deltaproteobacteria bacterium]MBW2415374.1 ferrous iron transporter B [Deltaproteobacteria bacterium]
MTGAAGVADPLRVALVGSPNSGKTTLFNALTGAGARVGNYPGVTVERREGSVRRSGRAIRVLDLPGTYSLEGETPDEQVVERVLGGELPGEAVPDALLIVADGTTLRRGLGLVAQLLQSERPTALVVTMIDEVRARGGRLDLAKLSRILGVPVLGVVGSRGVGLPELRELLEHPESWSAPSIRPPDEDPAERFAWVDAVAREIGAGDTPPDTRSDAVDRILLHPVGGGLVFAAVMVLLFQSIFAWAVPAMDAIDGIFGVLGRASAQLLPAGLLTDLWIDGVLAGVGGVLIFLPQIVILFTLIHFLEDVGYMARAAFVVDRLMGLVGLQGRCFVALLSSYACAIPGIMAARSISSPRDRLATILVAPFMTCSARLPVYTLLIAAFVPAVSVFGVGLQGLVMLALYALGVLAALGAAALLKSTLLRGQVSSFYMELPPYRMPSLSLLASQVWASAWAFIKRAGTLILLASVVLWTLLTFPRVDADPSLSPKEQAQVALEASAAASIGRAIEPAIEPLGFDWRIGVGLVASLAAREVIVSTLSQIYAVGDADDFDGLRSALRADTDPETGEPSFTLPVALSLLVFFVFALQCTSTIAVMARETGSWRWPALAFSSMLALAYVASFVTYRVSSALLS